MAALAPLVAAFIAVAPPARSSTVLGQPRATAHSSDDAQLSTLSSGTAPAWSCSTEERDKPNPYRDWTKLPSGSRFTDKDGGPCGYLTDESDQSTCAVDGVPHLCATCTAPMNSDNYLHSDAKWLAAAGVGELGIRDWATQVGNNSIYNEVVCSWDPDAEVDADMPKPQPDLLPTWLSDVNSPNYKRKMWIATPTVPPPSDAGYPWLLYLQPDGDFGYRGWLAIDNAEKYDAGPLKYAYTKLLQVSRDVRSWPLKGA